MRVTAAPALTIARGAPRSYQPRALTQCRHSASPRPLPALVRREARAAPCSDSAYWGIIEALAVPTSSQDQARLTARQLQLILTADDNSWSIRDDGAGSMPGTVQLTAPTKAKPLGHGCT